MRVDPSEKSKQDVLEIARYIAADNMDAAMRFLDSVEETYTLLADFPDMGRSPVFDFAEGLQVTLIKGFKHYQVYYRVLEDMIRIERVADSRRHLPALFRYLDGE